MSDEPGDWAPVVFEHHGRELRWALIEAVQRSGRLPRSAPAWTGSWPAAPCQARNIAKTAAARHLATLVFYGLRDGHIRALDHTPAPTEQAA